MAIAVQDGFFREVKQRRKQTSKGKRSRAWLPQKIIQCGKATGVMVDESREG